MATKAQRFAELARDTRRVFGPEVYGPNVEVGVSDGGELELGAGDTRLRLDPEAALALGKWLVQTFGEEGAA